jgi:hypothetical protein
MLQLLLAEPYLVDEWPVEDTVTRSGEGADGELRLVWRAQLANDHRFKPDIELPGNLRGDDHPTAGETNDHYVVRGEPSHAGADFRRQLTAGINAIPEALGCW